MVAWGVNREDEVRAGGGGQATPGQVEPSFLPRRPTREPGRAPSTAKERRTRRRRLRPSPAGWDWGLTSWHPVCPVLPRQGLRAAPRAGVLTLEGSRRSHRCRQGPSCTWSPGSVLRPGRVEGHLPRPGASRTPPGAVVLQGLAGPRGGQTAPGKSAEKRHCQHPPSGEPGPASRSAPFLPLVMLLHSRAQQGDSHKRGAGRAQARTRDARIFAKSLPRTPRLHRLG